MIQPDIDRWVRRVLTCVRQVLVPAARHHRCMVDRLEPRRMLAAVPVGPQITVASYLASGATNSQIAPSVSAAANGNFVVVWADNPEGTFGPRKVYGHRYSSNGEPVHGSFLISEVPDQVDYRPVVAMAPSGESVVAWQAGGTGQGTAVAIRHYDSQGNPMPEALIGQSSWHPSPAVAINEDGAFAVSWLRWISGTTTSSLMLQLFAANGVPSTEVLTVDDDVRLEQRIGVAVNSSGDTVVTWLRQNSVWARMYGADGLPRTAPIPVNASAPAGVSVDVAMDADGDFLVTWGTSYFDSDVYARRFDFSGSPVSDSFLVTSYTTGPQRYPSVAVSATGDFVIAWDGVGPSGSGIYARTIGREGVHNGDDFFIAESGLFPRVAIGAQSDFIVTWALVNPFPKGVQAQRFTWDTERPVALSSEFHYATAPHAVSVQFSEDVSASLSNSNLVVTDLGTGSSIPPERIRLVYETGSNVARFYFDGAGGPGILPEGAFAATLIGDDVTDASGNILTNDVHLKFSFWLGDANGDGLVDLDDFQILAANFGQSPRDFTQGDFNYDGTVDLQDFNILAERFGVVVQSATAREAYAPARFNDLIDTGEDLPVTYV